MNVPDTSLRFAPFGDSGVFDPIFAVRIAEVAGYHPLIIILRLPDCRHIPNTKKSPGHQEFIFEQKKTTTLLNDPLRKQNGSREISKSRRGKDQLRNQSFCPTRRKRVESGEFNTVRKENTSLT